ncbi:uncharacterized protein LOC143429273 [Xylocopa sonorina]|uniref:uncharacterized protein LOC143429273 n=1 Tax=Xylocopa sonorina TaxID=1818115 RepID=UPI00403B1942
MDQELIAKYENEKWDIINSPQFVDFSNYRNTSGSFVNKLTVIVSTPIPNDANGKHPNTITENHEDETLIASLRNISLSGIECESETSQTYIDQQENDENKYIIHKAKPIKFQTPNVTTKPDNKDKKSQNPAVYPFTFDLRQNHNTKSKQAQVKKILEDEEKVTVFRAKPLPKFIETRRKTSVNDNHKRKITNNNNKTNNNKNEVIKKHSELWKKPPLIPILPHKKTERAKTPPLRSAARALERKRFDQYLQEKERLNQQLKEMEIAAKKKQEQKEILELRQRITFKAKPIRKYKPDLPRVEKRPLTDPISPITLKRRRRIQ